jgi:Ca2+-binding EF-hand superfamily protein
MPRPPKTKKYTSQELAHLRQIFNEVDTDGNGVLDESEIAKFLDQSGETATIAPIIIRIFDRNHDGSVTFNEFLEFVELSAKLDTEPLAVYRALFNAIDTDGSGELDAPELAEFARLLGLSLTGAEAQEVVSSVDRDGNGTISFAELILTLALE